MTIRRTYVKLINLNCITNSCNWNTYVTWRGNEYELSEDDTTVSKHVGSVIIYKFNVTVLLMVILQNKKTNKRALLQTENMAEVVNLNQILNIKQDVWYQTIKLTTLPQYQRTIDIGGSVSSGTYWS